MRWIYVIWFLMFYFIFLPGKYFFRAYIGGGDAGDVFWGGFGWVGFDWFVFLSGFIVRGLGE